MNLNRLVGKIAGKAISGCLLAISASGAYSGAMGSEAISSPGKIYIGAFGGGGTLSSADISQYGTAFFTEALGGL